MAHVACYGCMCHVTWGMREAGGVKALACVGGPQYLTPGWSPLRLACALRQQCLGWHVCLGWNGCVVGRSDGGGWSGCCVVGEVDGGGWMSRGEWSEWWVKWMVVG
eukprot:364747-Chlamydomonas_euryale.AAC.6